MANFMFYASESNEDGALVCGGDILIEIHDSMCMCGDEPADCQTDGVRETIIQAAQGLLADSRWSIDFEDGWLKVEPEPTGVQLIAAERARQIAVERWNPEHDDEHRRCQMLVAAQSYVTEAERLLCGTQPILDSDGVPITWPWDASWWKPSDEPIRNLIKAAALFAAEIDRLTRAQATAK